MAPHDGSDGLDQTTQAASIFKKEFDSYQKMTAADYLEHSLLFGAVQTYLQQHAKALRVLDLGCGDSQNISKLLSAAPEVVASYTGVDMSESAITHGQAAMQQAMGPQFPVFFHLSDMLSFLQQTRATYDVVVAAFALHHLTSEDKAKALKEIHRLVSPVGGAFVMVDPLRREGESLQAYRQRATEVGETWTDMGREQQDRFIKHMQDYDIVEGRDFFETAGKEAGFASVEQICNGQKGLQSSVTVFKA